MKSNIIWVVMLMLALSTAARPQDNHSKKLLNKEKRRLLNKYSKEAATPPDHTKVIAMARFVLHEADWTSIATISTMKSLKSFPFTNVVSMVDGPVDNSTGVPYFYLTPLDFTSQDLDSDNRATISVTLEETDYCRVQNIDPEDPRCARVMLSGTVEKVPKNTPEHEFAEAALFSRHPSMATLPTDHGFYVAKLNMLQIAMLDWFGGPKFIDIQEFLNFDPTKVKNPLLEEIINRIAYGTEQV